MNYLFDLLELVVLTGYNFGDRLINCLLIRKARILIREGSEKSGIPSASKQTEASKDEIISDREPRRIRKPTLYRSFISGTKVLLGAPSGTGKTLLLISLLRRAFKASLCKKACIFSLEDKDGEQSVRFLNGLQGNDFRLVTWGMFERRTEEFKAKIRNDASFKSMLYEEFPMLKRLYHNEKAILAENGLHNKLSINMAVFLQFVREMIAQGYNWFGLDSLGDLIPNLNTITRNELNEFLDIITKAQVTFIVIHHPNGKSGFRGSKDIPSVFDSAYMLEEITRLTPKGDAILKVNVLKDRFGGEEDFFVKREYVNDDVAKHKIISADEVAQFQKKAK